MQVQPCDRGQTTQSWASSLRWIQMPDPRPYRLIKETGVGGGGGAGTLKHFRNRKCF